MRSHWAQRPRACAAIHCAARSTARQEASNRKGTATSCRVATYHDSCAALREYGIKREPRILLEKVRGLELREMKDTEVCCGFGGTFTVKYEPISVGMGEEKIKNAEAVQAEYIISTDVSCLMHMEGLIKKENKNIKTLHLADVLASGWD